MKITFLGAAECVTGSKFFVEHGSVNFLVDAGLFQERHLVSRNWDAFPISPSKIQAVFLTHAHIDHCGYLPKLVKEGFRGKIYCTAPTKEITKLSLMDSAKLQEEDAAYKLKRHKKEGRKGPYPEIPLYSIEDAQKVFHLFKKVDYGQSISMSNDVSIMFYSAGHILGSAMLEARFKENGQEQVCVFSGDIGRAHKPILSDPYYFKDADYVVMEATYGDRAHEKASTALDNLAAVITETANRQGKILIPSFAINRTQELMYDLDVLADQKRIPLLPLYIDSPMAADVTDIFNMFPGHFDQEAKQVFEQEQALFHYPRMVMSRTQKDSKSINDVKGPAIIIASSGMCTGGRIKHHLFRNISNPANTILFTGFQAQGTLGRVILEKPNEVRILGNILPLKARVVKINGFSAHADKDELLSWLGQNVALKKVFLVHSERNVADVFAKSVKTRMNCEVIVPRYLDQVKLEGNHGK